MALTLEELFTIIKDADTQCDIDKLSSDVNLESIGVDSLDFMTIFLGVQEASGVEVDDDDIGDLKTPQNICDYVNSKS